MVLQGGDACLLRRLWQEKQEKAFQIWLNALLTPQAAAPEDDGGLAAKRLHARVRGQIWHMYCSDPGVLGIMTRLEKRVDEGFLRMKDEVGQSHRRGFVSAHRKQGLHESVREKLSGLDFDMCLLCVSCSKAVSAWAFQHFGEHAPWAAALYAVAQGPDAGRAWLLQHIMATLVAHHPKRLCPGLQISVGKTTRAMQDRAAHLPGEGSMKQLQSQTWAFVWRRRPGWEMCG